MLNRTLSLHVLVDVGGKPVAVHAGEDKAIWGF